MKNRYMIWKDIHSFFRDFRSFLLLFLTPIFITILVGSLFMSSGAEDIPIIVCTEKTSSLYNNTLSLIRGSDVFVIHEAQGDCENYIKSSISRGVVRAGIIVPEIEIGSVIDIYVDNTKPIGTYLQSYFNLVSRDISTRLINQFISDAVSNMESGEYQINQISATIDDFDAQLMSLEADINSVENLVSQQRSRAQNIITLSGDIQSRIDSVRAAVSNTVAIAQENGYNDIANGLSSVGVQLDQMQSDNYALNTEAGQMRTELSLNFDSMKGIVASLRSSLADLKASTNLAKTLLLDIKGEIPEYSDPVRSRVIGYFGEKSYINFIFPSILIMIVMWMATFLSSINFIRQKSRGILQRLYVSPMSTRAVAFEKIVSNTLISLIPLPFILAISFFILGIELNPVNAVFVFLAASLSVVVFAIIGLIIGTFSKTESTAILGSLIIIIPLMFMSGAFYPVEAFPDVIKLFAEFLPINAGIRLVEGFLFYSFDWVELMFLVYTMLGYALLLSGVCWMLMRRSLKA